MQNIKNAQFETKLAYLCKLVKEKKNIGTDLIDILNNESAINVSSINDYVPKN